MLGRNQGDMASHGVNTNAAKSDISMAQDPRYGIGIM